MKFEDIAKHIPSYLDKAHKDQLSSAIKELSEGSAKPFVGRPPALEGLIQGDVVDDVPIPLAASENIAKIQYSRGILVSNSCDASVGNARVIPIDVLFAPMIELSEFEAQYKKALFEAGENPTEIDGKAKNFFDTVRKNEVTNLFFIPARPDHAIDSDCIAMLDKLVSVPFSAFKEWFKNDDRIASLNLLGWYLFLVILSRHFSRTWEGIKDRDPAF